MIRIDSIWLATEPMDMRAGTETALARGIAVFGAAQPHCAYLFANRRANRMKVLVHASQRQTDVGRDGTQARHIWIRRYRKTVESNRVSLNIGYDKPA